MLVFAVVGCLSVYLTACMHTFEILIYNKFRSLPSCGFEQRFFSLAGFLTVACVPVSTLFFSPMPYIISLSVYRHVYVAVVVPLFVGLFGFV